MSVKNKLGKINTVLLTMVCIISMVSLSMLVSGTASPPVSADVTPDGDLIVYRDFFDNPVDESGNPLPLVCGQSCSVGWTTITIPGTPTLEMPFFDDRDRCPPECPCMVLDDSTGEGVCALS